MAESVNSKKRYRPTIAEMRALEERIGTLEDEKYQLQLKTIAYEKELGSLNEAIKISLEKEYGPLKSQYESKCHHYDLMAKSLDELRVENSEFVRQLDDIKRELYYLQNRGFWARLFNRH